MRNASGEKEEEEIQPEHSQSDLEEPVWYLGAWGMILVLAKP